MSANSSPDYRSYLLRLWRADEISSWRAVLEEVHSGRRHGFATLAQLVAFLEAEIAGEKDEDGGEGGVGSG